MFHNTLNDAPRSFFIPTGMPLPEEITNGNVLRNINSYEYLGYIAINIPKELADTIPSFRDLYDLYQMCPEYVSIYPYGNLYTRFLLDCEKNALIILQQSREYDAILQKYKTEPEEKLNLTDRMILEMTKNKKQSLNQMLDLIFANPNRALERSYEMIAASVANASQSGSHIESVITKRLDEKTGGPRNYTTPQSEGSALGRLSASLSRDYKPITITSIPSIRIYQHQQIGHPPIEYRFGTQGEIHMGKPEVNPIFKIWVDLQKDPHDPNHITHIYFNNLAFTSIDASLKRECDLSSALHALTNENLAVITLPAYMSLMNIETLTHYDTTVGSDYKSAKNKMLQVATGAEGKPIEDFYISDNIKKQLYGPGNPYDKTMEQRILSDLLKRSFKTMGIDRKKTINLSQQQAVFFHFIKFELTNYILEKLQPDSFNMSCKDAIDRGGISSAYYNFIKSLEKGVPMCKEEFLCALHGAPTLVKGRGMNFHIKIIWNAIDHYIQAYDKKTWETGTLPPNEVPSWLRTWRDENALPHSKTKYIHKLLQYINQRASQSNYLSIFGEFKKMDVVTKLKAATKLLMLLEGNNKISFSAKELICFHDGRLGMLYQGIVTHHVLAHSDITFQEGSDIANSSIEHKNSQ